MSGVRKRSLSALELQNLVDTLSDVSDVEEPFDDSDADPCYAISEYSSEDSSEYDVRRKKPKNQDLPQKVCLHFLYFYH